MKVIVVGGGKTGSQLAAQLLGSGHEVRVVDDRPPVVERLRQELTQRFERSGLDLTPAVDRLREFATVSSSFPNSRFIAADSMIDGHSPTATAILRS